MRAGWSLFGGISVKEWVRKTAIRNRTASRDSRNICFDSKISEIT